MPEGEEGRFVGDELKYNAAAERVMSRHGVLVNDLHSASRALPPSMFAGPGNVHFSAAGSAQLAAQVVSKVEAALAPVPPPAAAQTKSVLFIGDAAGAQYAERLRDLLKPRVELHFLSAPRGGKAQRNAFLGELAALVARHDLVLYAGGLEAARVSLETGKPELGAPQFRQFLEELRKTDGRGKKSGGKTKWIWATAVPVPEGHATLSSPQNAACNRVLTDLAYNRHAILLDLHEYVRIRREDMQRPGDFLLSEPGVTLIASVVANKIEEVMLEGSVPGLPNVLVLGDSIVGQYSTFLRGALLHKANVWVGRPTPASHSSRRDCPDSSGGDGCGTGEAVPTVVPRCIAKAALVSGVPRVDPELAVAIDLPSCLACCGNLLLVDGRLCSRCCGLFADRRITRWVAYSEASASCLSSLAAWRNAR